MIQVTDKIAVSADEHQYIVGKPRLRADRGGNTFISLDNPCYYTTIAAAVKNAVSRAMREGVANGTITTLREFIVEQERTQNEFKRLLKPLEEACD